MQAARTWTPRALAIAAFAIAALAAPPGWYWLDGAELSAAGFRLGSSHPTGFPLYMLLARSACLIPVGELAFRINLASAVAGALAVLWVSRLVVELSRDDAAALAGAVTAGAGLMATLMFFRHATIAEVYVPTAALLALSLLLFVRVARGAGAHAGLGLAVVAGLGLGLHGSYRVLLALPIVALLLLRLYRGARWPLVAPVLALGIAAALHTALPVRAASGRIAAVDWGHPRTAAALYDHAFAARRIRDAFAPEMLRFEPPVVRANLAAFSDQLVDHHGPLVLLAAAGGLLWLALQRRDRWLAAALAVILAGDVAYTIWLNPMGIEDMQNGTPFAVAASVAAGVGVAWLARATGSAAPFVGAVAALLAVLPSAARAYTDGWPASRGDTPRVWAEAALDEVPPRGVALVETDHTAGGLLWLTAAEGARPDAVVLVKQHLRDAGRSRALLTRAGLEGVSPGQVVNRALAAGRPIAWEPGTVPAPPGTAAVPDIPLGRLVAANAAAPADIGAALARTRAIFTAADVDDAQSQEVFARALVTLGRYEVERRRLPAARALFEAALAVRPTHVAALVNLGVVAARKDRYDEARRATTRALALAPLHAGARTNDAYYRFHDGDFEGARAQIELALEIDAGSGDAWALAGILDARDGTYERARRRLAWALLLEPGNPDARAALAKLPRSPIDPPGP